MFRRNVGKHRFHGQADAYRPRPAGPRDDADRFLAELRSGVEHPIGMPAPTTQHDSQHDDDTPDVPPIPDGVDGVCLSSEGPRTDRSLTRGVESGIDDSAAKIGRVL